METSFSNLNLENYISTDKLLFSKYVFLFIKKTFNIHICILYVK